jgi:septal ring factor EnvC (AmiA/AmiB activator)
MLGFVSLLSVLAAHAAVTDLPTQSELEAELRKIDSAITRIDRENARLATEVTDIQAAIDSLHDKEKTLRTEQAADVLRFNATLLSMARVERTPAAALAAYDAVHQQGRRRGILAISRQTIQNDITTGRDALKELIATLNETEATERQLKQALEAIAEQKAALADMRRRQTALLALPEADRRQLLKEAQSLGSSASIDDLFAKYQRRTRTLLPERAARTYARLPVDGRVIRHWNDPDPTTGLHAQGLTVRGEKKQGIKAVVEGRVIYSDTFKGYGNLVILEHTDNLHTLYSGLGQSTVAVGDFVAAGGILGFLPDEEQPTLYFELRRSGQAINPSRLLAAK